jgi:sulfhydrogenase subunit beta (sulfur reductase)
MSEIGQQWSMPVAGLQRVIDRLREQGFRVVGPVLRDGAVMWDDVGRLADLPAGWRDSQEPGRYRLERTGSARVFDVVHGPQSVKPLTFAPREPLLTIARASSVPVIPRTEPLAVIGLRACDLAGLAMQDRIFLNGPYADPYYRARREGLFLIPVNCTRALATCFCASMGTGPRVRGGFDLALTELDEGFLVEAGTERGLALAEALALEPASAALLARAAESVRSCADSQVRRLDQSRLPQGLYDAHDHPRWDDVAGRCLACTNCTMVCPTCFCHAVEESPDLTGQHSERARLWDSCFTQEHGYIHGKNIRPTIKDRYRMWLTHKLASWIEQFGASGCVGCGRCITWCPVGIDLTEELPALLGLREQKPG